jgi:hypothetical protein
MGHKKKVSLARVQWPQGPRAARYAPKISNLQERAAMLIPPATRSQPLSKSLSSKTGIVVIPPGMVGIKPAPLQLKITDNPQSSTSSAKKGKSAAKRPKLPPPMGTLRFQEGVRFVQGGLPELGRNR